MPTSVIICYFRFSHNARRFEECVSIPTRCFILSLIIYLSEKVQSIKTRPDVVANIVASWAFGVADQILEETNVSSLPKTSLDSPSEVTSAGQQVSADKTFHPARSSSLSHRPKKGTNPSKLEDTTLAVFAKLGQKDSTDTLMELNPAVKISDIESLAGHRAELYMLQRQIMERTAEINSWAIGLNKLRSLLPDQSTKMEDVDLNDDADSADESATTSISNKDDIASRTLSGICQATLLNTMTSLDDFKGSFEVGLCGDLSRSKC
jgi:hypothetical protein